MSLRRSNMKSIDKAIKICDSITIGGLEYSRKTGEYMVNGEKYSVYTNAGQTASIAISPSGEYKFIRKGGAHFSSPLEYRKRIAIAFRLPTFREKRVNK